MYSTQAIAKLEKNGKYELINIGRGWTSEDDLDIDIKYCGFCHTDIHLVNNDFGRTEYPAVVGHEVAGIVTKVGANVKVFVTQGVKFYTQGILFLGHSRSY